ncbi:molybdopterin-dependent oxidoreductase, partial [Streptomyces sp. I8-5]|uniref:molybdopterin-dependent oxidoreductase n=1 Tax=Streptomyces sp. I8-5 TaxID=3104277 RepID=UPI0038676114
MGQPESRERSASEQSELPPGQRLQRGWPVTHYGPVPKFKPDRWEFRVFGATADGEKHCWNHQEFSVLPFASVVADLHCVTKFSMIGAEWGGVLARTVLELAPPAPNVTHVMVWAEY